MGTSIILLLFLLVLPACSIKKSLESSGRITVYIGQPFEIHLKTKPHETITFTDASDSTAGLPPWIVWQNNTLSGIARYEDAGALFLIVNVNGKSNGNTIDIFVTDETKNPCGKEKSVWFEMDFDGTFTTAKLIQMVARTSELFQLSWDDIRVYTAEYLKEVRSRKPFFENRPFKPQSTVITFLMSCNELVEDDVMENVAISTQFGGEDLSSPVELQVATGMVLQRKQRHPGREPGRVQSGYSGIGNTGVPEMEQTTPQPVTSKATRLSVVEDKKPSVVMQLETVRCERGAVCEVSIPENMFNDEDGTTSSLHLSIIPVDIGGNKDKWLDTKVKNLRIRGVPLKSGNFTYRLDARDSKNQLASAAFTFNIAEPKYPYSHEFSFDTAMAYDALIEPKERLGFYDKLSKLVKKLSSIDPGKPVILKSIEKQKDGKAKVAWVFPTQRTECPVEFLKMRTREIIQGNGPSSEVHNFMSSKYSIRGVQFRLSDECERANEKAKATENRNTTKSSSAASEPTDILAASESTTTLSAFPILVPLAAITVLVLLLLICLTTLCILKRKNPKTAQSEYVSKGYPVLLLGELPQEEDTPNASTPMLVKEERPPLVISQHENPLYKPPPPLSAASSPRQHNLQLNTRLPPPYVPP
uniref:DAG1 domain-containing protein n=1 Tax=Syphacia muris TaxID=451379 RepID=A0A0N5AM20_9BILA